MMAMAATGELSEFLQDRLRWTAPASFQTTRLADAQRHLRAFERHTALGIAEPSRFGGLVQSDMWINSIWLSRTAIRSAEGYSLEFRPQGQYCLNIPQSGAGSISSDAQRIEMSPGRAVLVAPGHVVRKQWLGTSDVLTVHIPSHLALEMGIDAMLGCAPLALLGQENLEALLHLLSGVCGALDHGAALRDPGVAQHMERAIVAMIAHMLAQGQTQRSGEDGVSALSGAIPYYVRRAERFMRGNFRPGITLNDMAEAAGVSRRTLQYGFRRYHRMTPMHYFRKIRLDHARSALMGGDDIQLTQLAFDVGYQNGSHFGSDYRSQFGESPSQTRARARDIVLTRGATARMQ